MSAREVFVSYSEPDRACALELVERVEAHGIPCWVAPRDIAPSTDWAAEIIDAIGAARVMVLVFSASSNESPQVRREVERAVHKRVSVLPFRIEDVLPSKSLEYFLSTQHWLDAFPPPRESHYRALCAHLAVVLSTPPRAVPAAAFDGELLGRIERALAAYIGPIARHLVVREARTASGIEALIAALAAELDADAERRRFVESCQRLARG